MKISTSVIIKRGVATFCKPFLLLVAIVLLCSHDLYIKMESYFLEPYEQATVRLYNGTFEHSENIITRDRMLDASVIAQGKRTVIDTANWKDQDSTITHVTFNTGAAGTYVVGVSTRARNLALTAEKFNAYLKSDGVFDMLEQRTKDSLLDQDAVESYEKHVKAIYQVGDVRTDDWGTVLGYPIEFVPRENPYGKYSGETLEIQLLLDGMPLANQLVFADYITSGHAHTHPDENQAQEHTHDGETHSHGHKDQDESHEHGENPGLKEAPNHEHDHGGETHSHGHQGENDPSHAQESAATKAPSHEHEHEEASHSHEHLAEEDRTHAHQLDSEQEHSHTSGQQLRTNSKGLVTVNLPADGIYYLRTIFMNRVTNSDELTHRSKWATLTFEVSHSHDTSTHDHAHDQEDGFPLYVFIIGSILIVGILFLIFRKKG
ncbi:MAG: NikM domain containing protein [Flavobacteriaceae bacterium]|nr:NikM domain containing protein [Flavobacteriaceae bacterium]